MSTRGKFSERLTMKGQIHKAYKVLLKIQNPKYIKNDQTIPMHILKGAKGIAFLTILKGGFVWSGTLGSGIVIAKKPDGTWSGPSSLGVAGMGWGALIGASSTDSVIILNTDMAVKAFSGKGQVKFGGNLSVAVGPVGREGEIAGSVGDKGVAPCYSYSHSRGLFGGLSLQGAILGARDGDNKKFYGQPCSPGQILRGEVTPPENEDLHLLMQLLSDMQNKAQIPQTIEDSAYSNDIAVAEPITMDEDRSALGPVASGNIGMDDSNEYLPEGWKEYKDPSGKPYYWNEQTNTTQWEKPKSFSQPMSMPDVPSRASSTTSHSTSAYSQAYHASGSSYDQPVEAVKPLTTSHMQASAPPAVPERTSVGGGTGKMPVIPPRSYR